MSIETQILSKVISIRMQFCIKGSNINVIKITLKQMFRPKIKQDVERTSWVKTESVWAGEKSLENMVYTENLLSHWHMVNVKRNIWR